MEIKNLENTTDVQLYDAFISAFSNYEVKIDLSLERFRLITYAKDYDKALSIGCFDGDELLGFVITGRRGDICYDIATGVTAGNQNRGIGGLLLNSLIDSCGSAGISEFYLEVLQNNKPAQSLYTKNGFEIGRSLCCYELERDSGFIPDADSAAEGVRIFEAEALPEAAAQNISAWQGFEPTWQNSSLTWKNSEAANMVLHAELGGRFAGYIIADRNKGNVLQLGTDPSLTAADADACRRSLIDAFPVPKLYLINIEENSGLCRFYDRQPDIKATVKQYEMICRF